MTKLLNTIGTILAFALFIGTSNTQAKEGPVTENQDNLSSYHGIAFPKAIGPFKKSSTKFYSNELGVSARYDSDFAAITIYVYNNGLKTVPDGIESKIIVNAFHQAEEESQKFWSSEKVGETDFFWLKDKNKQPVVVSGHIMKDKNDFFPLVIGLTGYKNNFLKILTSILSPLSKAEDVDTTRNVALKFLNDFIIMQ